MRFSLTNLQRLGLSIALFLWPVVLGFTGMPLRLLWITGALAAIFLSSEMLRRAVRQTPDVTLTLKGFPLVPVLLFCGALAVPLFRLPITFFSDEAGIAIPSLTLLQRVASIVTWPGLTLLSLGAIALFLFACSSLRREYVIAVVILLAGGAVFVGWHIPDVSSLATRYPPFLHIMQSIGFVLTGGSLDAFRMPNVLWTLLLAFGIWKLVPEWTLLQRTLAFLTPMLTPVGWTYRMHLYQACGEITLGMCATLLLHRILSEKGEEKQNSFSALTGMLFSFWILYRPTAIAILIASTLFLFCIGRRRSAFTIAGIAGPIAMLWIGAYFLGNYQAGFLSNTSSLPTVPGMLHNILIAAEKLPSQFHPAGLIILVGGSLLIFVRKRGPLTYILLSAFLVALSTIAFHHAVLPTHLAGFARFNALLVLPLAIVMAGLASPTILPRHWQSTLLTGLCIIALLAVTPFDFRSFTQEIRTHTPEDIRFSPTAGDLATPLPRVVRDTLQHTKNIVVLQPDVAYLDLFVARGLLSLQERTDILVRSREWTPASPDRPVLIQAPAEGMTFAPNLPAEEEVQLREAELWARTQPGVQEIRLGTLSTLIVP